MLQNTPSHLHGSYSLSVEVIHHPVGAYCIRLSMYPAVYMVDILYR